MFSDSFNLSTDSTAAIKPPADTDRTAEVSFNYKVNSKPKAK